MLKRPRFEEERMLDREERSFRPTFGMDIKTGYSPKGISFDSIRPYPFEEIPLDDYRHPIDLRREENPFKIEEYNTPKKSIVSERITQTFNRTEPGSVLLNGVIHDESGQPMPSATISVIGNTTNGVSTDFDGNYSLIVSKRGKVQVRFIGYKTLVFDWDKIPNTIKMKVDANTIEEIKLPDVKKKSKTLLYVGAGLGILGLAFLASNSKEKHESGLNGTQGLTAKGRLKKGFKYGKGGKIIKAKQSVKAVNVTL